MPPNRYAFCVTRNQPTPGNGWKAAFRYVMWLSDNISDCDSTKPKGQQDWKMYFTASEKMNFWRLVCSQYKMNKSIHKINRCHVTWLPLLPSRPDKLLSVWTPLFVFGLGCVYTYEMKARFWPICCSPVEACRGIVWFKPTVFLSPVRCWPPLLKPRDTLLLAVTVFGLPGVEARYCLSISPGSCQ